LIHLKLGKLLWFGKIAKFLSDNKKFENLEVHDVDTFGGLIWFENMAAKKTKRKQCFWNLTFFNFFGKMLNSIIVKDVWMIEPESEKKDIIENCIDIFFALPVKISVRT
jgi:hypothetical protein